ncbi:STAS domain-containing protein [Pseudonocardia sp. DSM 110487]|uniref:STAS domain-containing protein n=1 Tax=Pseudonocardia sp. DSM 110487 TaxID=2865833 RepID=UPI001C6A4D5F|nr:STAS domain-containing protein [Pseudonocardia sp. DSM 110487]QYN38096.1 STAS domain-containing protein [Pseudonocardia sp. DSM 110487]
MRLARHGQARVLRMRGALTCDSAAAARDAVIEQLALVPAVLVLDLSGLTFVDRAGAESLWCVGERAERADIDLRFVASGLAWMHLSTAAVHALGPVYATVEEALDRSDR